MQTYAMSRTPPIFTPSCLCRHSIWMTWGCNRELIFLGSTDLLPCLESFNYFPCSFNLYAAHINNWPDVQDEWWRTQPPSNRATSDQWDNPLKVDQQLSKNWNPSARVSFYHQTWEQSTWRQCEDHPLCPDMMYRVNKMLEASIVSCTLTLELLPNDKTLYELTCTVCVCVHAMDLYKVTNTLHLGSSEWHCSLSHTGHLMVSCSNRSLLSFPFWLKGNLTS